MLNTIESISTIFGSIVINVGPSEGTAPFEIQVSPHGDENRYSLIVVLDNGDDDEFTIDDWDDEDDLQDKFRRVAGRDIDTAPTVYHLAAKLASYIEARRVAPIEIEARILASDLRASLVA